MKTIESLFNRATEAGGFHKLPAEEATMLDSLSKLAEACYPWIIYIKKVFLESSGTMMPVVVFVSDRIPRYLVFIGR